MSADAEGRGASSEERVNLDADLFAGLGRRRRGELRLELDRLDDDAPAFKRLVLGERADGEQRVGRIHVELDGVAALEILRFAQSRPSPVRGLNVTTCACDMRLATCNLPLAACTLSSISGVMFVSPAPM